MTVKTAISLDDRLLERVDKIAREMEQSRSGLIAIALRDFLQQYDNQRMLELVNEVYSEPLSDEEVKQDQALRAFRKAQHRRLVEGTW